MEDTQDHLIGIAEQAIAHAKRFGADAADAVVVEALSVSTAIRLGQLEDVERAEGQDIGLRVFIGDSQAIVSTNDFSEANLLAFAERAVAMARVTPPDPFSALVMRELYDHKPVDLDLFDSTTLDPDHLERLARETEEAALAVPGITNSEGAGAGYSVAAIALVTSNGFAGSYRRSGFSVSCTAVAGSGTGMERDYDSSSAVYFADLRSPQEIGALAADRAIRRLNPRKVDSCRGTIVFEPRMSRGFISHFLGAVNGASVARGTSFLKESLGAQIFPEEVSITDNPLKCRGARSRPFDGEGMASRPLTLVGNGSLNSWVLDTRSARKLGLASTGHATRGISSPPSPSVTNVTLEPGKRSREQLIGEVERGLLVTDMLGHGVNGVTGDYSRGAAGFWIENGEITYPVAEITVAGNLKDLFRTMKVADDMEDRGGINAPSISVEGATIAGR
ncbi:PmbA protein [Rhodoligotrophos appendicifer]|uniref:TldD/PmbA family protein n=1 Tax=Rhodoligotrophos appendicifer TaxID=987056 RepID=UPI001186D7A2|nr:metallopeptidase TldD-related protein [Rhodoligotrophos appendicifer]